MPHIVIKFFRFAFGRYYFVLLLAICLVMEQTCLHLSSILRILTSLLFRQKFIDIVLLIVEGLVTI